MKPQPQPLKPLAFPDFEVRFCVGPDGKALPSLPRLDDLAKRVSFLLGGVVRVGLGWSVAMPPDLFHASMVEAGDRDHRGELQLAGVPVVLDEKLEPGVPILRAAHAA